MSPNLGSVENTKKIINSGNTRQNKRPQFIIPKKDTPVAYYAKMTGMTEEEFMKWTGVKTSTLKKGSKIPLPMDKVPEGKGIYALARKYNMSFEEFCKLNKIPKPYDKYKADKNEEFYVKPYKMTSSSQNESAPKSNSDSAVSQTQEESESDFKALEAGALIGGSIEELLLNNSELGSFSPKEIADKLEQAANDHWGAVGKKPFDDMLKEINVQNVSQVLQEYSKANDGRSLINRITSEITSKQSSRKEAVMFIYDTLASAKGIPDSQRAEFVKELEDQFDSFGMVDTEKLDSMIDTMLKTKVSKSQVITHNYTVSSAKPDTSITLTKKSETFTAKNLQNGAIKSAKAEATELFKQYCKDNNIPYSEDNLDLAPMERFPAPIVKNGKIVASETALLKPTTTPNGKVVILNPGHGGYSSRSGYFDPGSYSFIKKGSGKYAPLLEYEKMNIYAEDTVDKLRSSGYSVVIVGGHMETISDQKSISDLIGRLQNGDKDGHKYNKEDIAFISLHADSQPGMSGSGICYDSRFQNDTELANTLKTNLNNDSWIKAGLSERISGRNGLQVLKQSENIPSVLLEVEYVNGSKCQNLDSKAFQLKFENQLIKGLNQYFGL